MVLAKITPPPATPAHIALCAGGTGGHLFPAEALAEALISRSHRVTIITDKRGDAFKTLQNRAAIYVVPAATLKAGILPKLKAVAVMALGMIRSLALILRLRPDAVVGFGGYPSFTPTLAAQLFGRPTVLHEQNAVVGKANAWLMERARHIALSQPETQGLTVSARRKSVITGNPVRPAIVAAARRAYAPPTDKMTILVTGGSQGATIFAEVVPKAVALLDEAERARLTIMHQCRAADIDQAKTRYAAAGVNPDIQPFFTDMATRLGQAQLFVGRGGASTVAEIATIGCPAVIVPYPGHGDMQQKFNAAELEDKGAAWVILQTDFTAQKLAEIIRSGLRAPADFARRADAARQTAKSQAAERLASVVESVL